MIMKISAAMISFCEERTIDLCLRSLKGIADEVIIVDTGSFDGTIKKAEKCLKDLHLPGKILQVKARTLGEARKAAWDECSNELILLTDSNLVFGEGLKAELKKKAQEGRICMLRSLNLMGDYEHLFTPLTFHSAHPSLFRRDQVEWRDLFDRPTVKKMGQRETLDSWAVNLSRVRPAWRYWLRGEAFLPQYSRNREHRTKSNIQYRWLRKPKYDSLIEYVEAEMGISFDTVKRIAPQWFLELLRKYARPLPPSISVDLPEVIAKEIENPRYKLVYEEGKIAGRLPEL